MTVLRTARSTAVFLLACSSPFIAVAQDLVVPLSSTVSGLRSRAVAVLSFKCVR
jgi:hypothetical protein